jgi:ferredoxin--NADP+ reductase
MNFTIINKQILADNIKRIDVSAPAIARRAQPGQFVSLCCEEGDERIPLAVVEADKDKGTITLIVHECGNTTGKLGAIPINESIFSILGPLGVPSQIHKKGHVVCIATGISTAQLLPICRALRRAGNRVTGIIGAKTKRKLMLEAQMRITCDKVYIATDDGSYERRASATDLLKNFLAKEKVDMVYAIGSAEMMQTVCTLTREKNIPTRVQLNPMMVDCLGMCGSCRVKVGGQMVLACTDGPEFDGHHVDFPDFIRRMKTYEEQTTWDNPRSRPNPKRNEPGTLTKFLSDILKG